MKSAPSQDNLTKYYILFKLPLVWDKSTQTASQPILISLEPCIILVINELSFLFILNILLTQKCSLVKCSLSETEKHNLSNWFLLHESKHYLTCTFETLLTVSQN